jgi:hypothetical protein
VCVCVCVCVHRVVVGVVVPSIVDANSFFLFFREIFLSNFFYLRRVFFMYRVIVGVVVAVDGRHELGALRRRSHVAVHAWGRGVV